MPEFNQSASREMLSVVNFADHQIIVPPNRLRHAIVSSNEDDPHTAMTRAEKALTALSEKFAIWMQAEWARLAFALAEVCADGFTESATARLLQIAHDIKGNAPVYGYSLAAEIAGSLCRLIENSANRQAISRLLVDRHVNAIGMAARGLNDEVGLRELRDAVTQHLLRETSPEVAAPSLAPV